MSLVIGIKEMYRNHPMPNLNNFQLVSWNDKDKLQSADYYIQHNIIGQKRKSLQKYYQYILNSKKPFIVAESAVFRRNMIQPPHPKAYHRYSWTSYFQDEGDYCNDNCPSDRWEQIQKDQDIEIKDWRLKGEYILIILQRPGDSSLTRLYKKYKTYEGFLTNVVNEIEKYSDKPILVRMHPLRQKQQYEILQKFNVKISSNTHGAAKLEGSDGLYKDFKDAFCVVGFNSNALTESICEGIPTFSLCSSSMAWQCSNKNLSTINNPQIFDRQQWLNNLGYCQWTEDEVAQGLPWYHLRKKYVH